MAIALIDSNNFYASCEQSIDPSLTYRPLVVLSNNDGCIIARNAEAKSLGLSMGQPYFKVRHELKRLGVVVRSSNYELYADMSQRLMRLLESNCEELEVYSIDEAFTRIQRPPSSTLNDWAHRLRQIAYQSLGLPISIGIGATKSQSKLANHLAKTTALNAGVFDIETTSHKDQWLEQISIECVWGIGKKLAHSCRLQGINNARQLRDTPCNKIKRSLGITGVRLQRELKGFKCLELSVKSKSKKETCVSKSFSHPISNIKELRQAIATYTVRACEKLREQQQYASVVTIFTRTSLYTPNSYSQSATHQLIIPSNNTNELLSITLSLTEKIFRSNYLLTKAGVIMQGLRTSDYIQLHLFSDKSLEEISKQEKLMQTIDNLNKRYGCNTVKWGATGMKKEWEMCRKYLSKASTTRLKDIPFVIS